LEQVNPTEGALVHEAQIVEGRYFTGEAFEQAVDRGFESRVTYVQVVKGVSGQLFLGNRLLCKLGKEAQEVVGLVEGLSLLRMDAVEQELTQVHQHAAVRPVIPTLYLRLP
jgi:hypothetical protein